MGLSPCAILSSSYCSLASTVGYPNTTLSLTRRLDTRTQQSRPDRTMGMSGITATGTLPLPKWLFFLRVAIIVLSLGVLIASAYNIALWDESVRIYGSSPPGFLIFCVIATWFILGTMLVFEFFFDRFYTRIAFVVLLVLDAIGRWLGGSDFYDRFYGSVAAAAALGAIVWVMIVVFIVFFVRACLRDGTSGVQESELGHHQPNMERTGQYPLPTAQH